PCLSGEAGVVDGDGRLCRPQPVWTEKEPPGCTTAVSPEPVKFSLNRLRKNHFGTAELRWPARLGQWERPRRIAARGWRDGLGGRRFEVFGTSNPELQIAPFSHVSRFTRHGLFTGTRRDRSSRMP